MFTVSSVSVLDVLYLYTCLVSISSCQFGPFSQTAWSVPAFSPGRRLFARLDLAPDHLKRADLSSSGFLVFVQLDLLRDHLGECRPVLAGLPVDRSAGSCTRSSEARRPVLTGLPFSRSARSCS